MGAAKMSADLLVRTGCAGWSIPRAYATRFAPGDSALERYATQCSVAEINSSFYRSHRRSTYERWANTVPADFRFSVKIPKTISHTLRLARSGPPLQVFLEEVSGLGPTLGVLLLQLPPSLAFDARTASTFFRMVRRRTGTPLACEPRHRSWFTPAAGAMLHAHGVARVAADPAWEPAAAVPGGHDGLAYWRWHGAPRMYYSAYSDAALTGLAAQIAAVAEGGPPQWVIFDNTAAGHAIADALAFQARVQALLGG